MNNYISTVEAAPKWGISRRRAAFFCKEGRMPGVLLVGKPYIAPAGAEKPADQRFIKREKKAAERKAAAGAKKKDTTQAKAVRTNEP